MKREWMDQMSSSSTDFLEKKIKELTELEKGRIRGNVLYPTSFNDGIFYIQDILNKRKRKQKLQKIKNRIENRNK